MVCKRSVPYNTPQVVGMLESQAKLEEGCRSACVSARCPVLCEHPPPRRLQPRGSASLCQARRGEVSETVNQILSSVVSGSYFNPATDK